LVYWKGLKHFDLQRNGLEHYAYVTF